MRHHFLLLLRYYTITKTETAWPTDVTPADEAEALENEDVKEETADGTTGADGLFDALATADGGGGSSSLIIINITQQISITAIDK